jgi:oxygen-independent coproporphyrinogen-3 oxidase
LRLNRGIKKRDFSDRFGVDLVGKYRERIDELSGLGLLVSTEDNIRLTTKGRLFSNEVFQRFI